VTTSHDTASAVAAVPAESDDFIYISSGTWSLMGIESASPLINEQTCQYNFSNETGYGRTARTLKNIMGLWLIQESRRQWLREGEQATYAVLEQEALASDPFRSLIDPDDNRFSTPGDMPGRIRQLCRETGQPVPGTRGEVMRCIYESLALKYRVTKDQIESLTGRRYRDLHVVGGGTKDGLLSQFTANATGCRVIAGPIEATALGNMAVQLIALGELASLKDARKVIAASFQTSQYLPQNERTWQDAHVRYRSLFPVLK
jgi:sugar (pentulose or hexulose) kinase